MLFKFLITFGACILIGGQVALAQPNFDDTFGEPMVLTPGAKAVSTPVPRLRPSTKTPAVTPTKNSANTANSDVTTSIIYSGIVFSVLVHCIPDGFPRSAEATGDLTEEFINDDPSVTSLFKVLGGVILNACRNQKPPLELQNELSKQSLADLRNFQKKYLQVTLISARNQFLPLKGNTNDGGTNWTFPRLSISPFSSAGITCLDRPDDAHVEGRAVIKCRTADETFALLCQDKKSIVKEFSTKQFYHYLPDGKKALDVDGMLKAQQQQCDAAVQQAALQAQRETDDVTAGKFLQTHNIRDLQILGVHLGLGREAINGLRVRVEAECPGSAMLLSQSYDAFMTNKACSSAALKTGQPLYQINPPTSIIGAKPTYICSGSVFLRKSGDYTLQYIEDPISASPIIVDFRGTLPSCGKNIDVKGVFADAEVRYGRPNSVTQDTFMQVECYLWGAEGELYFKLCSGVDLMTGGKTMSFDLRDEITIRAASGAYDKRMGLIGRPSLQ